MMTRPRLPVVALLLLLACGSVTLRASSTPVIQGGFSGIELCEQAVCGRAIFTGIFRGQVDANPFALGTVFVAVRHAPLPAPGKSAPIIDGVWSIQLLSGKKFAGAITGGSLFNNGNDTFQVTVDMLLTSNGSGTLSFAGILSHQTFPPTIRGFILQ
jgi:hypothetical protein